MTPVMLEVLLHTYYRPDPYPEESPAVVEAKIWLTSNGLAQYARGDGGEILGDGSMELTERGKAHVNALLGLPLPFQCWFTQGMPMYYHVNTDAG